MQQNLNFADQDESKKLVDDKHKDEPKKHSKNIPKQSVPQKMKLANRALGDITKSK